MFRSRIRLVVGTLLIVLVLGWWLPARAADRVVLKNGKEYEGTIVKETDKYLHIQTAERKRVFRKTDIDEIIRGSAREANADGPRGFAELDPLERTVRNARAEYILGRYDAIAERLDPVIKRGDQGPEASKARWLLTEAYERLRRFDEAGEMLEWFKKNGSPADRTRAQAHLDIFEQNSGYKLERVNSRLAKHFLPRDLYIRGKEPGALAEREMMERALQEYVSQILRNQKVSLQAFKDALDLEETVERIRQIPPAGGIEKHLPYGQLLGEVQKSLERARAILPSYADGYVLDLVRTEAEHLDQAVDVVFSELLDKYPENFGYAYNPENGKLTAEGRQEWRENCETFLTESKPLMLIVIYQLKKVSAYPRELRRLKRQFHDTLDRLKQMREAINKKKDSRIYV